MPKFRTKEIVEAFQFMIDKLPQPQWWTARGDIIIDTQFGVAYIPTPEGIMRARHGDWIIKINDIIFPQSPEFFKLVYEKIEE